jgi:thioredoxin reductase (NADPH)
MVLVLRRRGRDADPVGDRRNPDSAVAARRVAVATPPEGTPQSAQLTEAQRARLATVAIRREFIEGEVLIAPGDRDYPLMILESGGIEVVRTATLDRPESVIRTWGPGDFAGEWGLITGQVAFLEIRGTTPGVALVVPRDRLLRLLAGDAELSDVIMRELLVRRKVLRTGEGATSIEILGVAQSAAAHQLRSWAERQRIAYTWLDISSPEGASLARAVGCSSADLPIVLTPTATIPHATVGELSEHLGLSYRRSGETHDLVVVGAGPAGLAAAVYGASEGLSTVLLDGVSVGGQAAASSRIENYLGFPAGISGGDLMSLGLVQAQRFGATVSTPCGVESLTSNGNGLRLLLTDETDVLARAVVIATGAGYRRLPLERWRDFEGAGIFFSATEIEAGNCYGEPVTVIGGANSAGQAALFLAGRASHVELVIRGDDLSSRMSDYLVRRVRENPQITIRLGSEVTGLHGDESLEAVDISTPATGRVERRPSRAMFCFIGAVPETRWLEGVALDDQGFVLTDSDLTVGHLSSVWAELGRLPLPFETSMPGVFAVGDVRRASMKRVAAAVGEGSSAIMSVHRAIAMTT